MPSSIPCLEIASTIPPMSVLVGQAPDALAALYGARKGRRGRTAAEQDRPQEVYTPEYILRVVRQLWPEGIALDPCSGPESLVNAHEEWFGKQIADKYRKDGTPILEWVGPALTQPWRDRTFVNPPYKHLREYLGRATGESLCGTQEILLLGPTRLHRKWARAYYSNATTVVHLNPVTFVGHKQSFPEPVALWYWGERSHQLKALCVNAGIGEAL